MGEAAVGAARRGRAAAGSRARRWLVAGAFAGLGVLVVSGQATGIGLVMSASSGVGKIAGTYREAAAIALGFGAGAVLARWWPWLLLAGSLLALPGGIAFWYFPGSAGPDVSYAWVAGGPLVLVALLAAARQLADAGRREGAALAGAALSAELLAATLSVGGGFAGGVGLGLGLSHAWWRATFTILAAAGVAGALITVVAGRGVRSQGGLPPPRQPIRATAAGVLASLAWFLPAALNYSHVSRLLGVQPGELLRTPQVLVVIVGVVRLAFGCVLAALAGLWSAAAAGTAALVLLGVASPIMFIAGALAGHALAGLLAALAGIAVGCAVAASPWRLPFAAAAAVVAVAALLAAQLATGGQPQRAIGPGRWVASALLLTLLVVAVTVTVAVAADVPQAALPAAFGPIVAALVTGAAYTLTLAQLPEPGVNIIPLTSDVGHFALSAALLAAGSAGAAGIAAARWRHPRGPR